MANRVIRSEILTSDAVNSLSWAAEVFYRRLMSVVDDFGRYDGRVAIIRSNIYPLQLDKVSESDVIKWMDECSKAELVSFYYFDKKPYLEILKFGQTLRIKKSKFPANNMKADASICLHNESKCMSEKKGNESEVESEIENLIIIGGEFFKKKCSEILENEYRATLDLHLMGILKGLNKEKLLSEMDLEYPNYKFNDANHFANAVKSVGRKILLKNESTGKNRPTPTESIRKF